MSHRCTDIFHWLAVFASTNKRATLVRTHLLVACRKSTCCKMRSACGLLFLLISPGFCVFTFVYYGAETNLTRLDKLNLQYGFPADSFGYIFASFAVSSEVSSGWFEHWCTLDPDYWKTAQPRCARAIETLHGALGAKAYSKIQ